MVVLARAGRASMTCSKKIIDIVDGCDQVQTEIKFLANPFLKGQEFVATERLVGYVLKVADVWRILVL